MLQTVEATIDPIGQVKLNEKIRLKRKHRALVTILDEFEPTKDDEPEWSLVGSVEILDDDLESASREISEMFIRSIEKSGEEVNPKE